VDAICAIGRDIAGDRRGTGDTSGIRGGLEFLFQSLKLFGMLDEELFPFVRAPLFDFLVRVVGFGGVESMWRIEFDVWMEFAAQAVGIAEKWVACIKRVFGIHLGSPCFVIFTAGTIQEMDFVRNTFKTSSSRAAVAARDIPSRNLGRGFSTFDRPSLE